MSTPPTEAPRQACGTLEQYLRAEEIAPLPALTDREWDDLRRAAMGSLLRRFCTPRNLLLHRGRYLRDVIGFGWGGIYRSLRVGSIVTTSYRNEGHFRAGERIFGTGDFFGGAFRLPRSSADLDELVRVVNLRHHVAGVVAQLPDGVCVLEGYEADYAYVATAFIESLRRGYAMCGVPPDSRRGRAIGGQLCTILYQVAGLTGLRRAPRDVAAHDRFRDAYERRLADRPPSARVRRMGQEIARRIAPLTAAMAGETVAGHVGRHFDPVTADLLFPGGEIPAGLEEQRREWSRRLAGTPSLWEIRTRVSARAAVWQRPDVVTLRAAYRDAVLVNADDTNDDRLIGAILLHAIDAGRDMARPFELRTIDLAAGQPLIRQGETIGEMYVVLAASAPLVVLVAGSDAVEPRQLATLAAPTVLGEIGMWRGQPAVATVTTREPSRLQVLVIDAERFAALKEEPGFRAATAAEVQRRLAINTTLLGSLLHDEVERTRDPRLRSVSQLVDYLSGDSHVRLDAVIDLPDEATPAECVDALRSQADALVRGGSLSAELKAFLERVVTTIG